VSVSGLRGTASGYEAERRKWDEHAARAAAADLSLPYEDFAAACDRVGTMVGVAEVMGDLRGKRVLDYGCGSGGFATLLAKSGAEVTAFDISPTSVEVTRRRAEANGVEVEAVEAAAENLPFPDESFDVVFGHAVIHHLDVDQARPELQRVLRRGGKAVFSEPLGTNPVLVLARERLPYPGKTDRGIDRPLTYDDLAAWSRGFREFGYREIQLFAMVERLFAFRVQLPRLARLDERVLRRFPSLRRFCRYVVLHGVK
jgi:SAM-dependent methyltransferase